MHRGPRCRHDATIKSNAFSAAVTAASPVAFAQLLGSSLFGAVIAVAAPPGAPSVQGSVNAVDVPAPLLIVGSQSQHWLRPDPEIIGFELRAALGDLFLWSNLHL
jgi:hypothetical protein